MENSAKKIKEVLAFDKYVIPRYQRNYAWGKTEISQLIKDIDEFFPKEKHKEEDKKSYYLGSLVCFKRLDGSFELIDGQQRHTTLTLINLVLKNWNNKTEDENKKIEPVQNPNLKFDTRKKVQNYIENLYKVENEDFQKKVEELNVLGTGNFKDAIEIIQEELREKNMESFEKNFYENVYLFRVEVPEDTDLNHYFEIMNNRGEQLEKHEIVKALLMGKTNENKEHVLDKKKQEIFALIWDACADMSDYVYFNFDKLNREKLFTNEGELQVENFDSISFDESQSENNEELTIANIILNHNIPNDFPKKEKFIKDKYKSVIDFPNFLLQVLKLMYDDKLPDDKKVSLDDKKLLEQFGILYNELDPKEFIFALLKYRILFDNFLIKQDLADADESKQNWGIRKLNSDFETTIKTFKNDDELVKLQIMLYYSDSTNTYNNWLHEILKNTDFKIDTYTKKVWDIAKGKFNKENLSYPNISIFNFYFIDFLLWKLYYENIGGKATYVVKDNSNKLDCLQGKIDEKRMLFENFKFRQLSSREHLLSQEHAKRYNINEEVYNGIGNLCLISTSQNSKGNKEHPSDKKELFQHDNSSLKRLIMFESFEDIKWETIQINIHKEEIEELIKHYVEEDKTPHTSNNL